MLVMRRRIARGRYLGTLFWGSPSEEEGEYYYGMLEWGFTTPQPNNSQEGALCIDVGRGSTIPARGRVLIVIARPLKHVYLSLSLRAGRTWSVLRAEC